MVTLAIAFAVGLSSPSPFSALEADLFAGRTPAPVYGPGKVFGNQHSEWEPNSSGTVNPQTDYPVEVVLSSDAIVTFVYIGDATYDWEADISQGSVTVEEDSNYPLINGDLQASRSNARQHVTQGPYRRFRVRRIAGDNGTTCGGSGTLYTVAFTGYQDTITLSVDGNSLAPDGVSPGTAFAEYRNQMIGSIVNPGYSEAIGSDMDGEPWPPPPTPIKPVHN